MNRLVHSDAGLLRTIQISNTRVFGFVEGGLDRNFYDRLLERKCNSISHEVYAAKELPGNTGGKPRLVSFHAFLKEKAALVNNFLGKKYVCIFFADKDIDDVTQTLIEDQNFIYTETYDLEGHLFSCGDLKRALADAAHITLKQANSIVGNKDELIVKLTEDWSDWLAMCMISQIHKVNFGCSFERQIPIDKKQEFIWGSADSLLPQIMNKICESTGLSVEEFEAQKTEIEEKIKTELEEGNILKYFKGKWFKPLLQNLSKEKLQISDASTDSLFENILRTLVCQIPTAHNCRCCSSTDNIIRNFIDYVMN